MVGECRGKKFGSKLRASPPLGLNGDGPGCPAGPFFGTGLPTPGPPPTVARSDTAPDLGQTGPHQSSNSTAAKDKKKKCPLQESVVPAVAAFSTAACRSRHLSCRGLPQKTVRPFKGGELHQPRPALGTVGVPVGANGGDALRALQRAFREPAFLRQGGDALRPPPPPAGPGQRSLWGQIAP